MPTGFGQQAIYIPSQSYLSTAPYVQANVPRAMVIF